MLLLPFVENAFKHGNIVNGVLSVIIKVDYLNGNLNFKIDNSISLDNNDDERGIGLETVEKRLELLFKNSHQLKVNRDKDWFKVSLIIQKMNNNG